MKCVSYSTSVAVNPQTAEFKRSTPKLTLKMDNEKVKISPPLYLIGMKTSCWRCESKMSVVTLLAPHVEDTEGEICMLSNIEELPHEVLSYIQKGVPTFKLRSSKMAGTKYYANTCPKCRVIFGDFFLHAEPSAPYLTAEAAPL